MRDEPIYCKDWLISKIVLLECTQNLPTLLGHNHGMLELCCPPTVSCSYSPSICIYLHSCRPLYQNGFNGNYQTVLQYLDS